MTKLIGRESEIEVLDRLYHSKTAEFLAIYGRRRVGKTFLITQYCKDKGVFFEITGAPNASTKEQLLNFYDEYCSLFNKKKAPPKNWSEAFKHLREAIADIAPSQKGKCSPGVC